MTKGVQHCFSDFRFNEITKGGGYFVFKISSFLIPTQSHGQDITRPSTGHYQELKDET